MMKLDLYEGLTDNIEVRLDEADLQAKSTKKDFLTNKFLPIFVPR